MKSCSIFGIADSADLPISALRTSTGSSLQPINSRLHGSSSDSISVLQRARSVSLLGRNTLPTPYCPASGSSESIRFLHSLRRSLSGIPVMIPAPSPVFFSNPTPPR